MLFTPGVTKLNVTDMGSVCRVLTNLQYACSGMSGGVHGLRVRFVPHSSFFHFQVSSAIELVSSLYL